MLKDLYISSIDKHTPDEKLIESTKSAMYAALKEQASCDNSSCSAIVDLCKTSETKISAKTKFRQYAACCALFCIIAGIAVVCTVISSKGTSVESEPFASSQAAVFDVDSPNTDPNGFDITASTSVFSGENQNAVYTSAAGSAKTTAAVSTVTEPQNHMEVTTTTTAIPSSDSSQSTTTASARQNAAAVTTTPAPPPNDIPPQYNPPPKTFEYYDPEYDPNFNGGFEPTPEFLFEYEGIYYYFDCKKSDLVTINIDGEKYSLRQALNGGILTPMDLLDFEGFICRGYFNDFQGGEPLYIHDGEMEIMEQYGGFMNSEQGYPGEQMQPSPGICP